MARADGRAFSLCAVNRMFSFAAFFTAHVTLCVIRYDLLRIHTMRRRIGDRSAGGSAPIPSQLDRARTRFSTKIGSITTVIVVDFCGDRLVMLPSLVVTLLLLVCVSFTIIGQPRNSVLIRRV